MSDSALAALSMIAFPCSTEPLWLLARSRMSNGEAGDPKGNAEEEKVITRGPFPLVARVLLAYRLAKEGAVHGGNTLPSTGSFVG